LPALGNNSDHFKNILYQSQWQLYNWHKNKLRIQCSKVPNQPPLSAEENGGKIFIATASDVKTSPYFVEFFPIFWSFTLSRFTKNLGQCFRHDRGKSYNHFTLVSYSCN
jgi:hypothetical protein